MLLRIQIFTTREFLYLSDGALTVDVNSPLFQSQDDFLGSFSYPGDAPLERNRAKLNNAHLINSDASLRTFMVIIWLGSSPWKIARFNYIIKGNTISYTLAIDSSIIANQLKTLTINQLVDDLYSQINFATPADYLAYMMATVTATPGTYPVVFFPYKNDGAYKQDGEYSDLVTPVNNYFNDWAIDETGAGTFAIDDYTQPKKETQTPFYLLPYVLKRVVRYFGFIPVGKWLDQETSNRIVIYTSIPNFGPETINDYALSMPAIIVADFLTEVRTRFGLLVYFDAFSNTCYIESIDNLVTGDVVIDLRDRQLDDYEEVASSLRAYTISQSIDDKDTAFSDNEKTDLPVLTIGDPTIAEQTTNIKLNSVVTKMITEVSPSSAQSSLQRIPYLKQPIYGVTPFNQIAGLDYADRLSFKMRFLYYFGLQKNDSGYLYPYGSSDNLDINGQPIGNYSLAINATGTTALAIGRYYNIIKNSKPFQRGVLVTLDEFFRISARTRILMRDFNDATVVCLLDQISADLEEDENGMIQAKLTVYPVLTPINTQPVDSPQPGDSGPPVDNGTVYVKLAFRNTREVVQELPPPRRRSIVNDVWLEFYADAAATIPKNVTNLDVKVKQVKQSSVDPIQVTLLNYNCTTTDDQKEIYHGAVSSSQQYYSESYTYTLITNASYHIIT